MKNGLLCAAREARERADKERQQGNKSEFENCHGAGKKYFDRAQLYDEFAEWCEFQAGTYSGASMTWQPPVETDGAA